MNNSSCLISILPPGNIIVQNALEKVYLALPVREQAFDRGRFNTVEILKPMPQKHTPEPHVKSSTLPIPNKQGKN